MKLVITEHDKKLLLFLTLLVLVVCIGYWGIRPQLMAAAAYKEELEEEEALERQTSMKLAQLSSLQLYNGELEELIAGLQERTLRRMTSDELEAYITEILLSDELFVYDFSIEISNGTVDLEPYMYSEKALMGQSSVQDNAQALEVPELETDADLFGDEKEELTAQIDVADIILRVGGSEKQIQKLLDDLEEKNTGLHLHSCNMYAGDAGEMRLDLSIEVYMCEE